MSAHHPQSLPDDDEDLTRTVKYDKVLKPASTPPPQDLQRSRDIIEQAYAESEATDLQQTMRFRGVIRVPKDGKGIEVITPPGAQPAEASEATKPAKAGSGKRRKTKRRTKTRAPAPAPEPVEDEPQDEGGLTTGAVILIALIALFLGAAIATLALLAFG